MDALFDRHRRLFDEPSRRSASRILDAVSRSSSGKVYGETARDDGLAAYDARIGTRLLLPGHPESRRVGGEISPWGTALGIAYPAADAKALVAAAESAAPAWAKTTPNQRVGICLEALVRLNRMSFEIANAVMHTTGQPFPMAFQAGWAPRSRPGTGGGGDGLGRDDPQPDDRHLGEAAGQGRANRAEKHWRVVPRGIALIIGCQTFPTWNSYPGLFASLATGNR